MISESYVFSGFWSRTTRVLVLKKCSRFSLVGKYSWENSGMKKNTAHNADIVFFIM
jgi:hypothetical protein